MIGHLTEKKNNFHHKIIHAQDIPNYPLFEHFEESYEFIEAMRSHGINVLVHCHAGLSRSASIVCAYLMRKYNWNAERSLNYVRERRHRIRPN